MIKYRQSYLNRLIDFKDTEFIKVLTGVRRSGKSFIMKMYHDYLIQQGVDADQIIYINFEHPDTDDIKTKETLQHYLNDRIHSTCKYYFLFDEIQEVDSWQKVINGLRVACDSDIYLTGSNATMLSGELATLLSGRYVEIKVMPLSFVEFCDFKSYHNESMMQRYYQEYIEIGSFPSVALLRNESLVESVLNGIFDSIILKDVSLRGEIKDTALLLKIVKYLLDQVGHSVSATSIANTLSSGGRRVANETVDKYLSLLTDAFIFYKADRYDIRGKERLKTLGKYYVVDLGIRNSVLGRNRGNYGSQLENLIYLELIRRGYEVSVGKLDNKEIDFVCRKMQETLYVQVAFVLPENSQRETDNLLRIPDNYRKILITANPLEIGLVDGIEVIHVIDFLRGIT